MQAVLLCLWGFFSFLDITSGPFLAQQSVYLWASCACPQLLAGQFASILLPLATCPAFWNQVPGIQGPLLLLLPLFASLCVSSFLLSSWLHSSKLTMSVASQLVVPFLSEFLCPYKNLVHLHFIECDLVLSFCGELLTCPKPKSTYLGLLLVLRSHAPCRQDCALDNFISPSRSSSHLAPRWQHVNCQFGFCFFEGAEQKISAFSLATHVGKALELSWCMPYWRSPFEWVTSHETSGLLMFYL